MILEAKSVTSRHTVSEKAESISSFSYFTIFFRLTLIVTLATFSLYMNKEELNKLARLCRISCTPEEEEKFVESISQVLTYIEELKKVDTQGVPCCNMVLETLSNVMREDIPGELLSREAFLANSPSHVGGMVKVPPVLKQG